MRTLLLDYENGSMTLGSDSQIESMFGCPVLKPTTWKATKGVLGQIWSRQKKAIEKRVGDVTITEEAHVYTPRNGASVDTIVFDTATEAIKQFQRELRGDGRMTLPMWGDLKNDLDMFFQFTNQIPCNCVLNVHSKPMKDEEMGIIKYVPNVEGSSREDMAKFFDFVIYTKVRKDDSGDREYVWVTSRDERYDHAKDRSQLLAPEIPQDFNLILDAARRKGWNNIKVLVIGQPGSGKTLSLRTLNGTEVAS